MNLYFISFPVQNVWKLTVMMMECRGKSGMQMSLPAKAGIVERVCVPAEEEEGVS